MAPSGFLIPCLVMHASPPDIIALGVPYSKAMAWGTDAVAALFPPVRRSMQGMNIGSSIAFALVTANLINARGNWFISQARARQPWEPSARLVHGWARIYLARAVLVAYLLWYDRKHRTRLLRTPIQPDLMRIRRLIVWVSPAAARAFLNGP